MPTSGAAMCIGGPALVYWVSPTEEELFKVSEAATNDLMNFERRRVVNDKYSHLAAVQPRSPKAIPGKS